MVKNLPAISEDTRNVGLISVSGRSSEEGHGNPLQYSGLENPMDRGTLRATVIRSQHPLHALNCNSDNS